LNVSHSIFPELAVLKYSARWEEQSLEYLEVVKGVKHARTHQFSQRREDVELFSGGEHVYLM
jgi:hypothetical protein